MTSLPEAPPPTNLPAPTSGLIGREPRSGGDGAAGGHRLVTLTGPGGIGKTRLALEVARGLLARLRGRRVGGRAGVAVGSRAGAGAVAGGARAQLAAGALSPERVAAALGAKRLLLVLDNCEHVIEAAAAPGRGAAARQCPRARAGHQPRAAARRGRVRLSRCRRSRCPPRRRARRRAAAAARPRSRLFVDAGARPRSRLSRSTTRRRADRARSAGGWTASRWRIELAAARVAALGARGARGPPGRPLPPADRRASHGAAAPADPACHARLELRAARPSPSARCCAGWPSSRAASRWRRRAPSRRGTATRESEVSTCSTNLVAKSLVVASMRRTTVRYRLLETIRAYALEKLNQSGELDAGARRHAEYYRDLFGGRRPNGRRARPPSGSPPTRLEIDNVRTALDWAFSLGGTRRSGSPSPPRRCRSGSSSRACSSVVAARSARSPALAPRRVATRAARFRFLRKNRARNARDALRIVPAAGGHP